MRRAIRLSRGSIRCSRTRRAFFWRPTSTRPDGTKPRIYCKNLHLITKCFVGGTVVHHVNGVEECAAGVEVVLEKDGREVGRATRDTFGEFVIDRLEPNSRGYHLRATGLTGRYATQFDLSDESRYLGLMALAPE